MSKKEKILIIDDESICRTLSLIFRKKGYEIETATTGKEGLEKVQERYFNLTILDIKLPDFDGKEILKKIKKQRPDMVVIMVTGFATINNAVTALSNGASAYISKPMNMDKVLIMVSNIFEEQRLMEENREADESLRENEEEFRMFFETLSDAVLIVDQETDQVLDVNNAATVIYGYSRAEWLTMKITDISAESDKIRKDLISGADLV